MTRINAIWKDKDGKDTSGEILAFAPRGGSPTGVGLPTQCGGKISVVGVFAPYPPQGNQASPRQLMLVSIEELFIFNENVLALRH